MAVDPVSYQPFGSATWRDPYPLYARLRDEDPVHFAAGLDTWVVTRFADVHRAAVDGHTFSSAQGLTFHDEHDLLDLLPNMVMMDTPEHTRYRRLVSPVFVPRAVRDLEPAIARVTHGLVQQLCAAADEAGVADLVAGLARPLPCSVVAEYLGVPGDDRALFDGWTQALIQANAAGYAGGAPQALAELYEYFTKLIERRRRHPSDDLISDLLGDEGHEPLRTEDILGFAFVLVAGGNDTVTGLVGGAAELLSAHRDQRRLLTDQPELLPGAVEELLRLTTPVQGLCRVTTTATEIGGVELARGSRVLLCFGAANRDPREFGEDAETFDVTRRVRRQLSFSSGVHHCVGAHVARLQGRLAVSELLAACPDFEVEPELGRFADGPFVRRYESLPFATGRAA